MTVTTATSTLVAPTTGAPPRPRAGAAFEPLPAVLAARARREPNRTLFTALDRDGGVAESCTARELDRQARSLAVAVGRVADPGDRVLVPAMSGLAFHRAFLACLYGGFVAVPVPPIRLGAGGAGDARAARRLGRLVAICEDATPVAALVPDAQVEALGALLGAVGGDHAGLAALHLVAVGAGSEDDVDVDRPLPGLEDVDPASTAFLQYTSGSTTAPRGVVISHGAMLANQRAVAERYSIGPGTTSVSWLPLYHDMGLCAGLLQPLHAGAEGVVMEPETFLVRPQRWLEALSHREDAVTAAPDFAYLLAASRVTDAAKDHLDLSGWRMALCGAEPVRGTTVRLFADAFARCGLRATALTPAYGLAESTLFVSGNEVAERPFVARYDRDSLGRGLATRTEDASGLELVGAGQTCAGIRVMIVDHETATPCAEGQVGELWVRSESNGDGYWGQPRESVAVFSAEVVGVPGAGWLRTGDLGFRDQGELVVTGRLKDLVIIRGVNYYPHDFEAIAQAAHPALAVGTAAAFVDGDDPDRVRVVVEASRATPAQELSDAAADAARAITAELPVQVEVVVVERGQVPRTTSGKVRRAECAHRLGRVEILARWPRHD